MIEIKGGKKKNIKTEKRFERDTHMNLNTNYILVSIYKKKVTIMKSTIAVTIQKKGRCHDDWGG